VQKKVAEIMAEREAATLEPFFRSRQIANEIKRLQKVLARVLRAARLPVQPQRRADSRRLRYVWPLLRANPGRKESHYQGTETGYKIFDRYQECGIQGLTDRSRRPYRYANQLPFQVENYILNVKREHPSWGARKIRERLIRRFSGIPIPAKSTIHAVLDRYGLVQRRGRVRRRAQGTPLSLGQRPNDLWCTDYKGEFLLGNRQYCYPLTVTDHASRFLLICEALSSTREEYAFTVFERLFKERGLPANIRSDNGVPFASAHALFNLSKLADSFCDI
jgi:transposase InsO family protein